jgi:DNA-binding CsgD family transcriptional regulator
MKFRHTPEGLQTLAIRARARASGDSVPCARLRARTGTWFSLQASCLSGSDPGRERVAVVVSPASAPDLRPLVFSQHRLTPSEREVTELVLAGRSTKKIAGERHISPYTVQDRLKAIFEKFEVRSRRELVAHMNTGAPAAHGATVLSE